MTLRKLVDAGKNTILDHALELAAHGWYIFPLAATGDTKAPHPMTSEGREKKDGGHNAATRDAAVLRDWWGRSPNSGIGVHCMRSGIVVVDADPRSNGDKTLARLRKEHPGVFETSIEAITGRGDDGRHLFFAAEKDMRYPGNLGPTSGIDIKHNGYVVLAPSIHPDSGKPYRWVEGKTPDDGELSFKTLSAELCHKIRESGRNASKRAARKDDTIGEDAPDGDPFGEIDDRALGMTEEQIRKIVFDIPNEGHRLLDDPDEYRKAGARTYDDWFEVICGIYHETGGSAEGRQIALEWSEQGATHIESEFDKKWTSAAHEGKGIKPKTFRTAIWMSNLATKDERDATFDEIKQRFIDATTTEEVTSAAEAARALSLTDPLQREQLIAGYRSAFRRITSATLPMAKATKQVAYVDPTLTNVPEWCRNICYVSDVNEFYDTTDVRNHWTKQAFDTHFARHAMTEEDIRTGASKPTHLPSDLVMTRYNARKVAALGYAPWLADWRSNPFFPLDGRDYLNTYDGRHAVPAAKVPVSKLSLEEGWAVETFKRLLSVMYPDDEHMLCSCFKRVVYERKRISWAPLLYSVEGTGKTLLFELIRLLVGRTNVSLISGTALADQFNDWAEGKLVLFVEEVGGYGKKDRFDALNTLKPIITNDHISVRAPYRGQREVLNTISVFMTTNMSDAFDLSRGDTRIWVPRPGFRTDADVMAFKKANPHFYADVVDAFTTCPGAIKRYLIDRPYHPNFKPEGRAPASAMKQEIIERQTEGFDELVLALIADSDHPMMSRDLLQWDVLVGACLDAGADASMLEARKLSDVLRRLGFNSLGHHRVTPGRNGVYRAFWTCSPERFPKANRAALIRAYIAKGEEL